MEDLKKLWRTVFGDAPSIIDAYFDTFYAKDLTATKYVDGSLAAAAYVMPAGYLVNGEQIEKCAHIYAVAVYPEHRGSGFGIYVTNKAVELAKKQGFTAVILHPAEDSLFGYYEKHCGFVNSFSANTYEMSLPKSTATQTPVDAETYRTHREKFLEDIPHVELNTEILSFFQKCGGDLYVFENGCAAVEVIDGVAYFRELLGSASESLLSSLAGTEKCVVTVPGCDFPTGMIYNAETVQHGWIGLTLE